MGAGSWAAPILVAAVAIVAAIVLTRGDSSSGSSGNQTSSVITDRNSTAKVDWVSAGTWPPNYTNLQAAIAAMGLPSATATTGYATHFHAHITLYVFDGHSRKVTDPVADRHRRGHADAGADPHAR